MERAGIPGILIYEDLTDRCPQMHTRDDLPGVGLNSGELFLANVRTAFGTVATLARPIHPAPVFLSVARLPGDPSETVRLSWTGGFPAWDVHRGDFSVVSAWTLRDDAHVYAPELTARDLTDPSAAGELLFYSVEEYP